MIKLGPTREEIDEWSRTAPEGPVTIINLLKLKPAPGGPAAYLRYLQGAHGSTHPDVEVLHAGPAFHDFGTGEDWDYVIIARYPRFEDFAWAVSSDGWQASAAANRGDALEKTVMIVSPAGDLLADFGGANS